MTLLSIRNMALLPIALAFTALATIQPVGAQSGVDQACGGAAGPSCSVGLFCEVGTGRTRRFDVTSGRLTTIAGNGTKAYAGDGGPALSASFSAPHEIRFDGDGHLFVVERDAHVVDGMPRDTRGSD